MNKGVSSPGALKVEEDSIFNVSPAPVAQEAIDVDQFGLLSELTAMLDKDPGLEQKLQEMTNYNNSLNNVGGAVPIPKRGAPVVDAIPNLPRVLEEYMPAPGGNAPAALSSPAAAAFSQGSDVNNMFGAAGSSVGSNVAISPHATRDEFSSISPAIGGEFSDVLVEPIKMETDAVQEQRTLNELVSPDFMDSSRSKVTVPAGMADIGYLGQDDFALKGEADLDDYFTNDSSKNVSLGLPSNFTPTLGGGGSNSNSGRSSTITIQQLLQSPQQQLQQQQQQLQQQQLLLQNQQLQQQQQQQQLQQRLQSDSSSLWTPALKQESSQPMLFSSTSYGSLSGGSVFATAKAKPSASEFFQPANLASSLMNSNGPLSDILADDPSLATSAPAASSINLAAAAGASNSPSVSPNLSSVASSQSPSHAGPERHPTTTLHKLLLRNDPVSRPSPVRSPENRKALEKFRRSSLSASNPLLCQQLSQTSSSVTTPRMIERGGGHGWRQPRQHFTSVNSVGDNDSASIADEVNDVLNNTSPTALADIESDDEQQEGRDSSDDDDDDGDCDDDSDALRPSSFSGGSGGSMGGASGGAPGGSGSKKERHFWMYNVQAKGPKGLKIAVETKIEDPHVLNDIVDPVFSGDVQLQGIKHSGKARRGDGNDLTANPKKLADIGRELKELNKKIDSMVPSSELHYSARTDSKKEKNKLASRACRLKKKAQHEANKLKCVGLEQEHHSLTLSINQAKDIILMKMEQDSAKSQKQLTTEMNSIVKEAMDNKVAGQTTEFVNKQIELYTKSD